MSSGGAGGVIGLLVGAVVLIMMADVAPRLVIGLLVLILAGLVLAHSDVYSGALQFLSGTSGGNVGGSERAKGRHE